MKRLKSLLVDWRTTLKAAWELSRLLLRSVPEADAAIKEMRDEKSI
jgi:hypothetical protein